MEWKTSWKYMPINYNTTIGEVEEITQRTTFKNNISGKKIKVKFSNKYSKECLELNRVIIAQKDKNNQLANQAVVTCSKEEQIVIRPGEEFFSDEINWEITAGTDIYLFIHIKNHERIQSAVSNWSSEVCKTQYKTECIECAVDLEKEGWKESREIYPFVEADPNKANIVAGISEISICTDDDVKTVALFGDSITHMSYVTDALEQLMMQEYPGSVTVLNCGIGGNRLLRDASYFPEMAGEGSCFGDAGIKRFERDVFGEENPDYVIILEGVNDMMHPYMMNHPEEKVSAQELADGMKRIIDRIHAYGKKVYLGTVMPFKNYEKAEWFEEAEKVRQELNSWIRKKADAEGIIDYDMVMEDKEEPSFLQADVHIGDWLHPNKKGGALMAEQIFRTIMKTWG